MYHGLTNSILYTAYRLKTEFHRERDNCTPEPRTGTCFFVMNGQQQMCLVTNRHMLDAGYDDRQQKYLGCELKLIQVEGFLAKEGNNALPCDHRTWDIPAHQNQVRCSQINNEDVACLINPRGPIPQGARRPDFFIPNDFVADQEWLDTKLTVCDFVVFPGYPEWHDKLRNRPIMRAGTIASDPRSDYSSTEKPEGRKVAYEAFSFDGSSGSPVFATPKGLKAGAGIKSRQFREAKFIGINAGHMRAESGAHAGISYFFKSSVILDVIETDG